MPPIKIISREVSDFDFGTQMVVLGVLASVFVVVLILKCACCENGKSHDHHQRSLHSEEIEDSRILPPINPCDETESAPITSAPAESTKPPESPAFQYLELEETGAEASAGKSPVPQSPAPSNDDSDSRRAERHRHRRHKRREKLKKRFRTLRRLMRRYSEQKSDREQKSERKPGRKPSDVEPPPMPNLDSRRSKETKPRPTTEPPPMPNLDSRRSTKTKTIPQPLHYYEPPAPSVKTRYYRFLGKKSAIDELNGKTSWLSARNPWEDENEESFSETSSIGSTSKKVSVSCREPSPAPSTKSVCRLETKSPFTVLSKIVQPIEIGQRKS